MLKNNLYSNIQKTNCTPYISLYVHNSTSIHPLPCFYEYKRAPILGARKKLILFVKWQWELRIKTIRTSHSFVSIANARNLCGNLIEEIKLVKQN